VPVVVVEEQIMPLKPEVLAVLAVVVKVVHQATEPLMEIPTLAVVEVVEKKLHLGLTAVTADQALSLSKCPTRTLQHSLMV
jgi:hypothetical protein